jgi:hypothetical protein
MRPQALPIRVSHLFSLLVEAPDFFVTRFRGIELNETQLDGHADRDVTNGRQAKLPPIPGLILGRRSSF